MLQEIANYLNENSEFVTLVASLFSWLIGVLTEKNLTGIKRCHLIKSLQARKEKNWNIDLNIYKSVALEHYEAKFDVAEGCDMRAAMNIERFLRENDLLEKQNNCINSIQANSPHTSCNEFCIGGIIANNQTEYYFKRFFPHFRIYTNRIGEMRCVPEDKYIYSEVKCGFKYGQGDNEEYVIRKSEKYAILVRLTEEDFNIDDAGTVYILHGNNPQSTLALSEYILYHAKDLIRKTRKRKHFFIVFTVDEIDGEIKINMSNYCDLTNTVFKHKKNGG